eukprot:TRINITY_DN42_c0_g1_i2.p1 TRINITY_DN42_c0_g1~~TRINITY_DN42_c0_g1_i2.p1  ORF type:complete len:385 (+),score=117.56 TRINITY_DN42_c0_g1_i2:82-1155(+)
MCIRDRYMGIINLGVNTTMKLALACVVLLASLNVLLAGDRKCYALVLSSGGDKGAYQAGAIAGLINSVPAEQIAWDVVTGIGAGALNAAGISQFAAGQEKELSEWLLTIWKNISQQTIYKRWKLGVAQGLLHEKGLYNTQPLRDLLAQYITCEWKRKISLLATNLDSAETNVFYLDETEDCQASIERLMGSSALPIYFPYIPFDNTTYIDGAAIVSIDFGTAIKRCKEIVDDESDIVIDAILANTRIVEHKDTSDYKAWHMFMRYLDISGFVDTNSDLVHAREDFPNINFRYVIKPSETLPSDKEPLGFGHGGIEYMLNLGQKDAQEAVKIGEGKSFDLAVEEAREILRAIRRPKKL